MRLNVQDMQAAKTAIESHERLLIIPHANVDADGLSSALACYSMFRAMGKDCTVICPDTLPDSLGFLPGFEHLATEITSEQNFIITLDCSGGVEVDKLRYTVEDNKVNIVVVPKKGKLKKENVSLLEGGASYDLIVVVDSADLSLLGSLYTENIDLFSEVPILNIDHHISNTRYGQLTLIDPTAASATEVLYNWFSWNPEWKRNLSPDMATLLLTGLITDTRSFQNPNTTPRSLEVAAELLDLGARQQEIIQHVYKTKPLSTLRIWGRALNGIQVDPVGRIVWSLVSREDLQELDAKSKETHGILDELLSTVPDADVYALFTEVEDGGFKASLRSSTAVDVNVAASRLFGGGGHARASGFKMKQYSNFQLQVLECVQKLKEEIVRQREAVDAQSQSGRIPAAEKSVVPQRAVPVQPQAPHTVSAGGTDVLEQLSNGQAQADTTDVVKNIGA
jgi:bifunctional oligoribonuclease and PAP phosphatase NrnA